MRNMLEYDPEDIAPELETILGRQGVPSDVEPEEKVIETARTALGIFTEIAEPIGLIDNVSHNDFKNVYYGEGKNIEQDPVGLIYPRADFLALFAITVGEAVSHKVKSLFDKNDFALASMLDTITSEAVESAGIDTEAYLMNYLAGEKIRYKELSVLRYSPGYCGWHISGQDKLFDFLGPSEIGISLNESYLMQPLKSISGVMIVGQADIHKFEIGFSFCDNCRDQACQRRIASIMKND